MQETQPTEEELDAIKSIFTNIDAAINEHVATVPDQIGVLITAIMVRVANMMKDDPRINGDREINRITLAMKHEWRAYHQLKQRVEKARH